MFFKTGASKDGGVSLHPETHRHANVTRKRILVVFIGRLGVGSKPKYEITPRFAITVRQALETYRH
jgi:hypothetical protein